MATEEFKAKPANTAPDITIFVIFLVVLIAIIGGFAGVLLDQYTGLNEWFFSKNWQRINFTLSLLFSAGNLFLLGFIIFTVRRHAALRRVVPREEALPVHIVAPQEEVRESWTHIKELANSENPSDWNMAVLRADALLDDMLTHLGYEGTTLAERLKIVDPVKLPSIERIWSAHRLRNMIAHDPLEQHTKETIIHALRSYEQALKELDVLAEEQPQ